MDFFSSQETRMNNSSDDSFLAEICSHSEEKSSLKDESVSSSIYDISSDILRLEDEALYDSLKECEEYFEIEEQKSKENRNTSEKSIIPADLLISSSGPNMNLSMQDSIENSISKEAFSFIDFIEDETFKKGITGCNNESIREIEDSENLHLGNQSDQSSKRYKSSSSMLDIENSFVGNKPVSFNDSRIPSGFKNAKNEDILIEESKLQMVYANNKDEYEEEKISPVFINELISSLQENSNDTDFSFGECLTDRTEEIIQKTDNTNPTVNLMESGFKTGKNQNIMIDPGKLAENIADFNYEEDLHDENHYNNNNINNENNNNLIDTGFTTGKNKSISINTKTLLRTKEELNLHNSNNSSILDHKVNSSIPQSNINNEKSLGTYEMIDENGIIGIENKFKNILNENVDLNMEEIYDRVLKYFKKEDKSWIFCQFKWTWLHLFVNKITEKGDTYEEIIEIMKLRLKYERSVLRRIVEFDDVPFRFMVLGIIDFSENWIELFDGFYSVRAQIDELIYRMLKRNKCTIGSRLYVFGAQILLKEPTSIFDVTDCSLRLFYNSVKVCFADIKLGLCKKISFLNNISTLQPNGGVVSALVVRIKKILDTKYYVTVENYRNRVDDVEKEIEKIFEIASKTGHKLDIQDINIRQYCKVLIEDNTGECQLTWWSPPEIKEKEEYKFVFLNTIENSMGLHLVTTRQTYFEKTLSKK